MIICKKFPEYGNIMHHKLIDAAFHFSPDLAGQTIAVLIIYQQIRQITMPQITIESMGRRPLQKFVHTLIKQRPGCNIAGTVMFHQPHHIFKDLPVFQIFINDQFLFPHLLSPPPV